MSAAPQLYEKVRIVGTGTFGKAWLVKRKADGLMFCMKEILADSWEATVEAQAEAKIHAKLQHEFIIGFEECIKSDANIQIILEYASGGDLGTMLYRRSLNRDYFTEDHIMVWIVQILEAIDYIHRRCAIHRDIKAANVFIMDDGTVKIGDFGCAKTLDNNASRIEQRTCRTPCGTPMYQSPEQCKGNQYTQKVDIWALGCVLYEMCALRPTYDANTLEELGSRIKMAQYNKQFPFPYSQDLLELIREMFTIDTHLRPSTKDLLRRPFVQKYIGARIDDKGKMVPPPPEMADRLLEFNLTNGHLMRTHRDVHHSRSSPIAARKHNSVPVIDAPGSDSAGSSPARPTGGSAPLAKSPAAHSSSFMRAAPLEGAVARGASLQQLPSHAQPSAASSAFGGAHAQYQPRRNSIDAGSTGGPKPMRRNSFHPAAPVGHESGSGSSPGRPGPGRQPQQQQQQQQQQLFQQQPQSQVLQQQAHLDARNRIPSAVRRAEAFQYNYTQGSNAAGEVPAVEDLHQRQRHAGNAHHHQPHHHAPAHGGPGGPVGTAGFGVAAAQRQQGAAAAVLPERRSDHAMKPSVPLGGGRGAGAVGGGGGGGGIHARLPPAPQYQFSKLAPLPSVGAQGQNKGYSGMNMAFNQSYRPHRVKVASLFDAPE